jgi:hypothetical protein
LARSWKIRRARHSRHGEVGNELLLGGADVGPPLE